MRALKISRVIAVLLAILIGSQMIHVSVLTVKAVRGAGGTEEVAVYDVGDGGLSNNGVDALLFDYANALGEETLAEGDGESEQTLVADDLNENVFYAGEETTLTKGGTVNVGIERIYDSNNVEYAATASAFQAVETVSLTQLVVSLGSIIIDENVSVDESNDITIKISSAFRLFESSSYPELVVDNTVISDDRSQSYTDNNNTIFYFCFNKEAREKLKNSVQLRVRYLTADVNELKDNNRWTAEVYLHEDNGYFQVERYEKLTGETEETPKNGAKYTLYKDKDAAEVIENSDIVTATDGKTSAFNYPVGTYYIKETTAPSYSAPFDGVPDEITINGESVAKNESGVYEITITKGSTTTIKFVDTATKEPDVGKLTVTRWERYSGETSETAKGSAVYTLYTDAAATTSANITLTTDNTGAATNDKIPVGTYYIKETTAPSYEAPFDGVPDEVTIDASTTAATATAGGAYEIKIEKDATKTVKFVDTAARIVSPTQNLVFNITSFDAGTKTSSGKYGIPTANVAGMTVTLSQNSAAVKAVTSDANGVADFGIMAAGTYAVTFSQVNPYFPVAGFTLTLAQSTTGAWTATSSDLGTRTTGTLNAASTAVSEVVLVGSSSADTPATVNVHPSVTRISFKVYVNTAESCDTSVRSFAPSGELGVPDSISFTLYGTYTSGSTTSDPITAMDSSGTALAKGVIKGSSGVVTAYGMDYRAAVSGDKTTFYYAKYSTKSGAANMNAPGSTDLLRIQMPTAATGACVITPGNTNKILTATSRPDTNSVVGTIKHGAVAFTVNDRSNTGTGLAGCKYDVYRLYEGDGSTNDDGRGDAKVEASDDNYDDSKDSASSVNKLSLSKLNNPIEQMLAVLIKSNPYALKAAAAVATTEYPKDSDNDWQKIVTGVTSDSNGTVTINGLVPGQRYLIKQTAAPTGYTVTSNPIVIRTKTSMGDTAASNIASIVDYNGAANSTTSAVAQNGSGFRWLNGNGTAAAAASAAGAGTAAADGSGTAAADARGAATGDTSEIWLHLVIMLIAFDALAADLLFISRKKKVLLAK